MLLSRMASVTTHRSTRNCFWNSSDTMTISTGSSISTLDLSSTDIRYANVEAQASPIGIMITPPSPELRARRLSLDSMASIDSIHALPSRSSASQLAGVQAAGCTCICPMTGTAFGPACRLCRTLGYSRLQEEQARKTKRHNRLRSIASSLSNRLSALTNALPSSKRKQSSISEGQRSVHAKKDSLISWPDSEDTYVPDAESEEVRLEGQDFATDTGRKGSVSSRMRKLSLRSSFNGGFSPIADTKEEKEDKKEAKRREEEERRQREQDYWCSMQGQLDWRIMMAVGGVIW